LLVKKSATEIHHLHVDGDEVTELADISNKIGQTFSNNSSAENYNSKFQSFRSQAESQQLKFKSNNSESYNDLFSMQELTDAISTSHDMTVGPDDIHYQMLKHLPSDALNTLLESLNNIWVSGKFQTVGEPLQ